MDENPINQEEVVDAPNRKNIFILLLVLGILVLLAVGFYLSVFSHNKKTNIRTDAEIVTDSRQTYRNEEYGFEIKYPLGWGYRLGDDYYTYNVAFAREDTFHLLYAPTDWRPPVALSVFNSIQEIDPEVLTVEEYADKHLRWFSDELFYIYTVTGYKWTCGEVDGPGYNSNCLMTTKNGLVFFASAVPNDPIGDKILSSLSLINN